MEVNSMEPILKLTDVSYSYHTLDGETKALSDISFALTPGEFTAIVGPSGCGNAMCDQRKQIIRQPPIFLCSLFINGCHR